MAVIYEINCFGLANIFNLLVNGTLYWPFPLSMGGKSVGIFCFFKRLFYIERSVLLGEFEQYFL